jgi:acyl-CoA thioesterase-2
VSHQATMPDVVPPEELPTFRERMEKLFGPQDHAFYRNRPVDLRHVSPLTWEAARDRSLTGPESRVWLRFDGELPDDPLLHVCLMTYASDMTLLDTVLLEHGLAWGDNKIKGASLDHAMWFHRPFRADEWLLYAQDTPNASGARGLARGQVFTRDGELVVSVVQEGLIRVVDS